MRIIDQASWPRKSHYDFFRKLGVPHLTVSSEVDITDLRQATRKTGSSIFLATLFCLMRAVNAVPELRTRFQGDIVTEYETTHPAITVPIEGDRFGFCYIEYSDQWKTFEEQATEAMREAGKSTHLDDSGADDRNDWTYLTCLPWMSVSAVQFPVCGPGDCVPRVGWSKFRIREGRTMQPVHIMAHHALVDGLHVGRFFQHLETLLTDVSDTLSL